METSRNMLGWIAVAFVALLFVAWALDRPTCADLRGPEKCPVASAR
jgi:hypothetical protein